MQLKSSQPSCSGPAQPGRLCRRLDGVAFEEQHPCVSVADIIREIRGLPLEDQLKVIAFSMELDRARELTSGEFLALAKRYQDAGRAEETLRLEDELVRAFYGPGDDAKSSPSQPS